MALFHIRPVIFLTFYSESDHSGPVAQVNLNFIILRKVEKLGSVTCQLTAQSRIFGGQLMSCVAGRVIQRTHGAMATSYIMLDCGAILQAVHSAA